MLSYKRRLTIRQLVASLKSRGDRLTPLAFNKEHFFTGSARGGIELCIDLLGFQETDSVLLPAFVAEGVISPFKKKNINILFYKCHKDLMVDLDDLNSLIESNPSVKAMLAIHYFGFPQPISRISSLCQKNKIILFEDCAQALFSKDKNGNPLGRTGDISFYSLPKSLPVPDGALFVVNNPNIQINLCHSKYYKRSLLHFFSIQSHIFFLIMKHIELRMNYSTIYRAFNLITKIFYGFYYQSLRRMRKPTRMSGLSKKIANWIDFSDLIQKKATNSTYLYKHIDTSINTLLFPDYHSNFILTGVPLISDTRDQIVKQLKKKGIECLRYIKSWNFIPADQSERYKNETEFFNRHFLIPVNENISPNDMKHIIKIINHI
jgi:dTDP-4-amino-4,6-dideoxygalactose transaminase